jgi:hypothetical protein
LSFAGFILFAGLPIKRTHLCEQGKRASNTQQHILHNQDSRQEPFRKRAFSAQVYWAPTATCSLHTIVVKFPCIQYDTYILLGIHPARPSGNSEKSVSYRKDIAEIFVSIG